MDKQKEALERILGTVQAKSEEAKLFARDVQAQMTSLRAIYDESISEVTKQFEVLVQSLKASKSRMIAEIEEELCEKIAPLQEYLRSYDKAQQDTDDLVSLSSQALAITNHNEFSQAALRIKERVTVSPIFRLNLCPFEIGEECFFYADFSRERKLLSQLKFLPVPNQPEIVESGCYAENNIVQCLWTIAESDEITDNIPESDCSEFISNPTFPGSITYFILQYRQIDNSSENVPWVTVEFIRSFQYEIQGLNFFKGYLEFRVQAWNQALGGNWSRICAIKTPAFNFSLNPDAAHPNLKIVSQDVVEWDATASKVIPEAQKVRSATSPRSVSPMKSRRSKPKDRFTGESYTVLADAVYPDEETYFEVLPSPDCKTYSVGITLKSLARFDQLGKTSTSWCLHVSNWIQNTFAAKHNNKVKNLNTSGGIPSRIGVYFNQPTGILSFYNAETYQHIYTFKQVRCNGPIVPGFLMWFGSLQIFTGIQVPSWIVTRQLSSLNGKSNTTLMKSQTSSDCSSPEAPKEGLLS